MPCWLSCATVVGAFYLYLHIDMKVLEGGVMRGLIVMSYDDIPYIYIPLIDYAAFWLQLRHFY